MRATAIIIATLLTLAFLAPMSTLVVSAASTQTLWADAILSTDTEFISDNYNDPEALNMVNRDATTIGGDYTYDGHYWDSTPGCVFWGDAYSSSEGSYGTGEIRYRLTDLVGETADYYTITMIIGSNTLEGNPMTGHVWVDPPTEYLSFRVGFGYVDADSGTAEFIDEEYHNLSGTGGANPQQTVRAVTWTDIENEFEGRPFTKSEINNMYVVVQMRFDPQAYAKLIAVSDWPVNMGICFILLRVTTTTHTPATPQTGGFILRPNADNFAQGWDNYSVDGYTGKYGALNDTQKHGDAEQSYANATWSKSAYLGLGFTDPPSWAADTEYRVVLWAVIRHTVTGIGELHSITISISSAGLDERTYYPSTSYTNNTHESLYIPGSADHWTLLELEDIMANFWLDWTGATPSGELRMTQVAFLCVPIVPGDYVPEGGDYDFDSVREFFGEGNGFNILFAVIGSLGLIATAPLMIIFYRDGRESAIEAIALGACWIAASLGFLVVGLNPWT